jgi:hypothetical protein
MSARQTQPAPSPLVGEGWGEGWFRTWSLPSPLSLSLPHKGGGNVVALLVAAHSLCVLTGLQIDQGRVQS